MNPPKTAAGRRTLRLGPPLVDLLRKQRSAQAADRLRAGSAWQDSGYVFTSPAGHPLDPSNFLNAVTAAGKRVSTLVNVHVLRHTAATLMLRTNPVKDVSEVLGHANATITLLVYAHAKDDHGSTALTSLAAALDG